ncbi:hypothetical protein AMECASPLE_032129 [Ameca splendens]|uniref:Uncharacterized protein n=1 Tax=Ameca splendens TaxID=208324 RepID=A0ABV0XJG7_9TELE
MSKQFCCLMFISVWNEIQLKKLLHVCLMIHVKCHAHSFFSCYHVPSAFFTTIISFIQSSCAMPNHSPCFSCALHYLSISQSLFLCMIIDHLVPVVFLPCSHFRSWL